MKKIAVITGASSGMGREMAFQLAVFVKDDIDIPDDDDPQTAGVSQAGKAPQTGDRLPIYIFTGIVAAALVVVSVRKIRK